MINKTKKHQNRKKEQNQIVVFVNRDKIDNKINRAKAKKNQFSIREKMFECFFILSVKGDSLIYRTCAFQ